MRTLNLPLALLIRQRPTRQTGRWAAIAFGLLTWVLTSCSGSSGFDSIETDAHGYVCLKCGVKVYTERKVFLESKCPKCSEQTLVDTVGFKCSQDQHLTIRPKVSGPAGASVCEKCGAHLQNAMVSPREKDLIAWGATKTRP